MEVYRKEGGKRRRWRKKKSETDEREGWGGEEDIFLGDEEYKQTKQKSKA